MISNEQFGKTVHGGDLPEEVPHDNGYGTKTVYPKMACPACPAEIGLNRAYIMLLIGESQSDTPPCKLTRVL